ncbi:MAG TPA: 7-cyano-7-deazaguanine synthase [Gemmatales bacterium]|nr:7-cyano-7-deazaguanine synthase [Gemmatales bacterium]
METLVPATIPVGTVAVLTSGGLDSAILLADLARQAPRVVPLYVQGGLYWEAAELRHLRRYLELLRASHPNVGRLVLLDQPTSGLYGSHWSVTGQNVPAAGTADEAVYLPGRNVLLLAQSLLWCHLHGIHQLAVGVLGSNPFPDASPDFFDGLARVVGQAVGDTLQVLRPYDQMHKDEVMRRGAGLPLAWSFSCILPQDDRHCGACNKCAERQQAFAAVGWPDPTTYAAAH